MAEADYSFNAENDAKNTVDHFLDEILEQLIEKGEASDDLSNDYKNGDSYHHERHIDQSYSLLEAAQILSQLSNHEEGDSGLWEGQEPQEAVKIQAAFTYGNAVYSEWRKLIENINEKAKEVLDEFAEKKTELEGKEVELEAEEGGEDWTPEKATQLRSVQGQVRVFDRKLKKALGNALFEAGALKRRPRGTHGEGPREWSP